MGTLLLARLSSQPHSNHHPAALLVAFRDQGRTVFHRCLSGLCPGKLIPSTSLWSAQPPTHPLPPVLTLCRGLRDQSASVEYAHLLVWAASGMSPFMESLRYQPPLFVFQKDEVAVPSVRAKLHRCRTVWRQVRSTLMQPSLHSQKQVNHHRVPAPSYCAGQRVWLSKDLLLHVKAKKLAPQFVGPFEMERMVNRPAVRLLLPA